MLKGNETSEVIAQMEDSLMILGSLMSNRYILIVFPPSCCAKSLKGEAPCGIAVHGKVDEMSPAPSP